MGVQPIDLMASASGNVPRARVSMDLREQLQTEELSHRQMILLAVLSLQNAACHFQASLKASHHPHYCAASVGNHEAETSCHFQSPLSSACAWGLTFGCLIPISSLIPPAGFV